MKLPGFAGSAYTSLSVNADAQSCVNLYAEAMESGTGKASPVLYLTPGLSLFTTLPGGAIRGMFVGEGRLFVVAGATLYEVAADTTYLLRGNVDNDARLVQMFSNGNQLAIVSNQKMWIDLGPPGVPEQPVYSGTTDGVTARQGSMLDGYFLAVDALDEEDWTSVRRFRHSGLQNGESWDGLDFASKEGQPDQLNAMLADHEDLWLFGSGSTEVWRNNYSAAPESFPWERDPGAFIHYGIVGEFSHCKLGNGVAWLSGDPRGHCVAVHTQGYQPQRVSTHAIENEWATYPTVLDAESFSYTENGHHFWVINFHQGDRTWVYDATTKLWHRRGWWDGTSVRRHRARCHGYVFGKHLVGDWENGRIYEMSSDIYSDAGTAIHWERACPHNADEDKRIFHSRMELDMEKATGSNFNVQLEWSNDAGHTWQPAVNAATGAAGAHKTRVVWRRLGSARDRVYRFSGTTTNKIALIDAYLQAQAGQH